MYNIKKIKYLLLLKGINQKELSQLAGVAENTVSRFLVTGKARNETVMKIANALDVDIEELVIWGVIE